MKPGDAWAKVRAWFDEYGGTVRFALTRHGIPAASRPDLVQEVFSTAYFALLRDEKIERPRAWLRGVARGHASNFRRKSEHVAQPVLLDPDNLARAVEPGPSPHKQAEDRERLQRIFERIEPDAQELLLDVHVKGMSIEEIAAERGISANSARYLYQKAVKQAEDAVASLDSKERRWVVLPLAFANLIDSVRAEAEISPETHREIWESLDAATGCGEARRREPAGDRSRDRQLAASTVAAFAAAEPAPAPGATADGSRFLPRDVAPLSDEQRLLDRALAGIATANALSALDALTEHARRFPTSHAATRRKILAQVCAIPAARRAVVCSGAASPLP